VHDVADRERRRPGLGPEQPGPADAVRARRRDDVGKALKRTRYRVDEHGELGPVLTNGNVPHPKQAERDTNNARKPKSAAATSRGRRPDPLDARCPRRKAHQLAKDDPKQWGRYAEQLDARIADLRSQLCCLSSNSLAIRWQRNGRAHRPVHADGLTGEQMKRNGTTCCPRTAGPRTTTAGRAVTADRRRWPRWRPERRWFELHAAVTQEELNELVERRLQRERSKYGMSAEEAQVQDQGRRARARSRVGDREGRQHGEGRRRREGNEAKFAPRLVTQAFKAEAKGVLTKEQLDSLLEDLDLSKYLTNDGDVDEEKVTKKVSAFAPRRTRATAKRAAPRPRAGPTQACRREAGRRRSRSGTEAVRREADAERLVRLVTTLRTTPPITVQKGTHP
jgi:hypothetical protein